MKHKVTEWIADSADDGWWEKVRDQPIFAWDYEWSVLSTFWQLLPQIDSNKLNWFIEENIFTARDKTSS